MEIFVGNLPFDITEQEVKDAFAVHGAVAAVKMLTDRISGRFRGIAFVTMDDEAQAQAAISALNNADLKGRPMRVDQSRERTQRFGGFGGGFSKPREGGFRPREGGFRPREGGFRPRGEGGFRPREGGFGGEGQGGGESNGGGFRREGGFRPREGGFRPREGGFKPRGEGGFKPRGEGGFRRRDDDFRSMDES